MPLDPGGNERLGSSLTHERRSAHGWDIARSLGRSIAFDDHLVTAVLADARRWVDESARTPQLFGPEVTVVEGAPALDRLVAFLGRDPSWTPPMTVG